MRDKYSFSLRQLDSTSLDGRTLKFSEMGHLPRRPADEDEGGGRERERREKREWTNGGEGRRRSFPLLIRI